MKVLIVHYDNFQNVRSTQFEYLYAFRNYSKHDCYYLNVQFGIPKYLPKLTFDVIIFHYSFLALKFEYPEYLVHGFSIFKKLKALKVAAPQDEYINSDFLCAFCKANDVTVMLTCVDEPEWQKVYPYELSGITHFKRVLTGYIDTRLQNKLQKLYKPHKERKYDIGHRARKIPYWYGEFVQQKSLITSKFLNHKSDWNFNMNLSNRQEDVFYGDDWYQFISDCRVMLGTESGVSLLDKDGSIRERCKEFLAIHPEASFEEVKKKCFEEEEGNLSLYTVGPRFFQACMMRTCQVLLEGKYDNILKPHEHYIVIKKDWSNLDEVFQKIADVEYCSNLADRAYEEVVEKGQYTYEQFVLDTFNYLEDMIEKKDTVIERNRKLSYKLLRMREKYYPIFSPFNYLLVQIGAFVKKIGINNNKTYQYVRDQIYKLINWFYKTKETESASIPRF